VTAEALRRPNSMRLTGFDYTTCGAYHVVVAAIERGSVFGTPVAEDIQLNAIGEMVQKVWLELPTHYAGILVDIHKVMPDHFHGIVVLVDPTVVSLDTTPRTLGLSDVMQRFKAYSTTLHRQLTGKPKLWRRGFWDEIINTDKQLEATREYIYNNALKDFFKRNSKI
jgi:putative transposase